MRTLGGLCTIAIIATGCATSSLREAEVRPDERRTTTDAGNVVRLEQLARTDGQLAVSELVAAPLPEGCPSNAACHASADQQSRAAHGNCDAQCERCCPYKSVDECIDRECNGACERCGGNPGCEGAICNERWMHGCHNGCNGKMNACAGCRGAWCGEGEARTRCHAAVDRHHQARLHECDRVCPAERQTPGGGCEISCGLTNVTTCRKEAAECKPSGKPSCRCECEISLAGLCTSYRDVCDCSGR